MILLYESPPAETRLTVYRRLSVQSIHGFNCRFPKFTAFVKLKAGGKPSTWFPPGGTRRAGWWFFCINMCNPFWCDALASKPMIFNWVFFHLVPSYPIRSITVQSDPIQSSAPNIIQSGSDLILTITCCPIQQDLNQSDSLPNPIHQHLQSNVDIRPLTLYKHKWKNIY